MAPSSLRTAVAAFVFVLLVVVAPPSLPQLQAARTMPPNHDTEQGQQQQQVAAMTKFCRCYNKCYADCRTTRGPYPCNFECLQDCVNGQPPPPLPADCNDACLVRVCGVMETAGDLF